MSDAARDLIYLAAAAAFIIGLKRLGSPRTARSGNLIASGGMLVAVVVTLLDLEILEWWALLAGLVVGGGIGALLATRVQMTSMPQLVAAFNGFGGAASALVAGAEFIRLEDVTLPVETILTMILSVVSGSITLTGGEPSTFDVTAIEDTLALLVPAEVFAALAAEHPLVDAFFDAQRRHRMRGAVAGLRVAPEGAPTGSGC